MKQNIGTTDRIIRIAAGLAIGVFGLIYHNWLGLLALVPLLTSGIGVCLLYLPFGLSTVKRTAAAR